MNHSPFHLLIRTTSLGKFHHAACGKTFLSDQATTAFATGRTSFLLMRHVTCPGCRKANQFVQPKGVECADFIEETRSPGYAAGVELGIVLARLESLPVGGTLRCVLWQGNESPLRAAAHDGGVGVLALERFAGGVWVLFEISKPAI